MTDIRVGLWASRSGATNGELSVCRQSLSLWWSRQSGAAHPEGKYSMKARDIALAALAFGVAAIGAGVAYATASPVFATYTVAAPGQTIDIWGNFEPVGSVFALSSSAGTPSPASVTADDQGRIHATVVVPATYSQVSVKVVATRTDTTAPDLIGYFPLAAASVYSVRYSVIAGDSASMTAAHFAVGETVRVSSPDAVASGQGVADAQGAVTLPVLIQEPVRSLSPTIVATGATSGRTATVRQRVYSSTLWAGSVLPYGDELIAPKRKVMLTVVSDAIQTEAEIAYVAPTTYSETVWGAGTSSAMLTPVRLALQHDCNLVLYRNSDGRPLWSSGTYTHGDGCRAVIRDDASLVAYDAANRVVWSSGPWPDRLWAGQRLLSGRCKSSASLPASIGYRLCMQGDGNLVFYRRSDNRPMWNTHTFVPGSALVMQGDGNLVIYRPDGHPAWSSRTAGTGGKWVTVSGGGTLDIYKGPNQIVWKTAA
jgi:hypothetical protein